MPKKSKALTKASKTRTDAIIDLQQAIKLRLVNHLSYADIGKQLGVSKQAVHQALSRLTDLIKDPQLVQAFRTHKAEILESAQMEMLTNIVDSDRLKKASVNNLAYAASQLDNMIRLDRNQATDIKDYRVMEGNLNELIEQERRLMREISGDVIDIDDDT